MVGVWSALTQCRGNIIPHSDYLSIGWKFQEDLHNPGILPGIMALASTYLAARPYF